MNILLPHRPRRNRKHPAIRAMVREHHVGPEHLVYPLFIHAGDVDVPIGAMPGCSRLSPAGLMREVEAARGVGVHSFALFPAVAEALKTPDGREAHNAEGLIPRTMKALKDRWPEVVLVGDIALDPYNSDGHDGIVAADGRILNDETIAVLCRQAVCQARAGVDVVAPSDMMDGRVAAIRLALDQAGFQDVSILAYTAKYASAFYGPFREALDSAPKSGDKKTYQMDPANSREALREASLDAAEGADMLMVKPAGPYLDVIRALREASNLPIAAYQVSGEYAMLKAASERGWLDERKAVLESLLGIRRAGADLILTYYAKQAAMWLAGAEAMKRVEFWFDFSCPYAYVASTRIEALAARVGAELDARPMLLGGVFRARGTPQNLSGTLSPAKAAHNLNDMRRQAQMAGVPLQMPAGHPFRTVEALRCVLAVGAPFMPLAHHFYRAYWAEGRDLGQREVVIAVLRAAGHDPEAVLARANSEEIKDELRRRTDEAVERGIFGVPTCFVGDQLYWGQDRLDMVEAALGGVPDAPVPAGELAPVDLWFDYSSPFAYLALAQAEAMFGAAARWRPLLLGGLFRSVGTPDVPLFTMSPEKRRHTMQDLQRQASRADVPFAWPTRFPISTVLALRVTLQAGLADLPSGRALIVRIARALWAEDRDISDPVVLAGLCDELGFPGAQLVAAASEAKSALFAATTAAEAVGVFGVPTFVVHLPGREDLLYWGVDRMAWAARAAAGDAVVM